MLQRSLLSVSVLLLLIASAAAQVNQKEKAQKETERKEELQRKTYGLVDEIATGALSLKLPENRSFVLAEAADLLWEHNEKRARNLFWDALNTLTLMSAATNEPVDKKKSRNAFFVTYSLRREILLKVARRDPQLALDQLRSAPQMPPDLLDASYNLPDLEHEIAAEAAARDPKRALEIARASLAKGVSYQLMSLLHRLRNLDSELSSKFAGEIIDKLQTKNISEAPPAAEMAVELLFSSRTAFDPAVEKSYQWEYKPLKLSREQRRQLVEMIANAALGLAGNANLLYAITEVMPEIEEFAPERVVLLQKKVAAFNQTLNQEQKGWQQYNALIRNGTPEEMLTAAQNADNELRRTLHQQAIVLAVIRKRADSLREYIDTEIKDDAIRKGLIDALDTEQIAAAANKGDAEELRKLISRVRLKEERARAMAEMAVLLEKKGDHDEALKLLDEAQTLVKGDFSSETQSNALLALIAAYALVDPAKAFAVIEAAIDRSNDQLSKLLLLDKIVKTGVIKKGEIILQNSGVPIDFVMFKYGKGLVALANADFDRTKAAADRLSRSELRLMARLMLAQVLLRQDKPVPMFGENR